MVCDEANNPGNPLIRWWTAFILTGPLDFPADHQVVLSAQVQVNAQSSQPGWVDTP